jgi:hypothetical protein
MESVQSVDGKVELMDTPMAHRVDDLNTFQNLMPYLTHNQKLVNYCLRHFRDPDTLILACGRSCIVVSILEHDFFGRIGLLAWAQNPDHFPPRKALELAYGWAQSKGATQMVAFLDQEISPWKKLKGLMRLTGMVPFRMCFAKEL